jgi:hypothetical protein
LIEMTFERWQQVRTVLYPALKLEAAQRVAFVEQACAEDTFLHTQVSSLIGYHETGAILRLQTPDHLRLKPKPKPEPEPELVLEPAMVRLAWLDGYDEARPFRDRVLSNLPLVIGSLLAAALIAFLLVLRTT